MNLVRARHNPLELLEYFWPGEVVDHVAYDPKLRHGDYNIIRQCSHDGTLAFTHELLMKGLVDIVRGVSFCAKTRPADWSQIHHIEYVVGPMQHVTVFGPVALGCGVRPGQRERIRMPVKCEYVEVTK